MPRKETERPAVLVVEPDEPLRRRLVEVLAGKGFTVLEASEGMDALRLMRERDVQVVVTEVDTPGMDGMTLYLNARRECPGLGKENFIFTTGAENRFYPLSLSSLRYLRKPLDPERLARTVAEAVSFAPSAGPVRHSERRRSRRTLWREDCRLSSTPGERGPVASTVDVSRGGLRVRHLGAPLGHDARVEVEVRSLGLKKTARVAWSSPLSEAESVAGLSLE